MQINNTLSRWQLVPLVFMQDGFAASQTNVQLPIVGSGRAGYELAVDGILYAVRR